MQIDWIENPPQTIKEKVLLLKKHRNKLKERSTRGKALRAIFKEVYRSIKETEQRAIEYDPFSFKKPTYEQSLILNSWIWGISFNCIYSANRIGKTAACIINVLLWIFPNNPKWKFFKPYKVGDYTDKDNAQNPNAGKLVHVLQRPDISAIKIINHALRKRPLNIPAPHPELPYYHPHNQPALQWLQKKVPHAFHPSFPDPPWNSGGTIWFGGPDQDHHEQILFPEWKRWIGRNAIDRYVPSEREITITIKQPRSGRTTVWEMIGKSYESKDTKWSSGAVDIICLTEGITPAILNEVKLRFKDPGIGSHDFTPYLPANSGAASHLAQKIKKGTEPLPIPHFVFSNFSVYNAPTFVISKDKKEGLIKAYKDHPEGPARLEGKFYTSSLLILSNLSRQLHLLDWTVEELFQRYPNARLARGIDPGYDHPTSCAWGALLPTNQWVIYRMLSESGLDVAARCKKIILLSHNKQGKVRYGKRPEDFYLTEIHPNPNSEIFSYNPTDYHTFKKDEVTGQQYSLNYILQGLQIQESIHHPPEMRAQLFDRDLAPSPFLPHPLTHKPPAPKVFFLRQGRGVLDAILKWEDMYWERKKGGEDKGQPKDKVPEHGDDELDAVCYLVNSPFRWTNQRPSARISGDSEPEENLAQFSQRMTRLRNSPTAQRGSVGHFATVANDPSHPSHPSPMSVTPSGHECRSLGGREVVVFGEFGTDDDDD